MAAELAGRDKVGERVVDVSFDRDGGVGDRQGSHPRFAGGEEEADDLGAGTNAEELSQPERQVNRECLVRAGRLERWLRRRLEEAVTKEDLVRS